MRFVPWLDSQVGCPGFFPVLVMGLYCWLLTSLVNHFHIRGGIIIA